MKHHQLTVTVHFAMPDEYSPDNEAEILMRCIQQGLSPMWADAKDIGAGVKDRGVYMLVTSKPKTTHDPNLRRYTVTAIERVKNKLTFSVLAEDEDDAIEIVRERHNRHTGNCIEPDDSEFEEAIDEDEHEAELEDAR
jgi:hypothetical protein